MMTLYWIISFLVFLGVFSSLRHKIRAQGFLVVFISSVVVSIFWLPAIVIFFCIGIFSSKNSSKNSLFEDNPIKTMERAVVDGFRNISINNGGNLAPTFAMSDEEILTVYKMVLIKFKEAAEIRGEYLTARNLNFIALRFMTTYEMLSQEFFIENLHYEVELYKEQGLREDYKEELYLF